MAVKRSQWAQLKPKARDKLLQSHWFPAVRGPRGRFYIVDHHHLGQALTHEKVQNVWVMQLADFSGVETDLFWRLMEFHHWAHPTMKRPAPRLRGHSQAPDAIEG